MNLPNTLQPIQSKLARAVPLLALVFLLIAPRTATTQDSIIPETEISVGLGGEVRLGKWTPIQIKLKNGSATPIKYEVTSLDGDDTPVIYGGELVANEDHPNQFEAWTRLGRNYGEIVLRLLGAEGELIEEINIPLRGEKSKTTVSKSTRPFILTLESGDQLKSSIESNSALGPRETTPLVITPVEKEALPSNWLGYDSFETIVMVTSDLERIQRMSKTQIEALRVWVENGGTLILSVSKNAEQLLSNGGLLEPFLPGNYEGLKECRNSKRLESYADSNEQLIPLRGKPIQVSSLSEVTGKVLVYGEKKTPLIISNAMGYGDVTFVCFDLDSERIANWKGGIKLVGELVSGTRTNLESQSSGQRAGKGTSVSTFGYTDLIGQLRVPLDQFSKVKFVAFMWIALLIGLYILCIGPGDFFFLKKLARKMELTWITFPLLALLFCGLAFGISRMTRPNSIQLNQLEIIDIDSTRGRTRGSLWANLYSPHGGACDVSFAAEHNLGFQIDSEVLTWHGLPGDGLGGMWSSPTPGLLKTGYKQTVNFQGDQKLKSSIIGLPLQVSSTKPMFGQWWADNSMPIRSDLDSKSGRLSGTVKNPFDFRIKNCRLIYENWAYVLDRPLEPSETFDLQTETKEKTLRGMLTRKVQESEKLNRSNNTAWDPTDTKIDRIANMMMFYRAAGGSNYTGLSHNYQPFADMSNNLYLNRAVLVGEVDKQGVELLIDEKSASEKYDQTVTIVRILLPVAIK